MTLICTLFVLLSIKCKIFTNEIQTNLEGFLINYIYMQDHFCYETLSLKMDYR